MRSVWLGYVMLAVVVGLWGLGPLAIDVALSPGGGFGPLWLNATRLAAAAVVLLIVAAIRGVSLTPRLVWGRILVMGTLAWTLGSGLQVVAQTEASSGVAAVFLGAGPVVALAAESVLSRRMPAIIQVVGVSLAVLGLVMVVGIGTLQASPWAIVLLLGAVGSWAAAALVQARRPAPVAPMVSAAWQMVAGAAGLGLAAVVLGEQWPAPTALGWLGWAFLALGGAGLGFVLWLGVLSRIPITVAMVQPTLSTVLAVVLGVLVLGESVSFGSVAGIAIAILGSALVMTPVGALVNIAGHRDRIARILRRQQSRGRG